MKRLLIILFLYSSVFAQQRREYTVREFTGGLNVVTDSIDLALNEMVQADNFTMDRFGALHKRFGIDAWNDSLISADTIMDIHYLENKSGDKMLYIATNNYIYEAKTWEDVDSMETWDSLTVGGGSIVDYTRGQIDTAISGQKYIYGDTTSWMLSVLLNDIIIIGSSTYTIDSVLSDTSLHVVETVATHGGENYRILKNITGRPSLSSYNGILYVADDLNEPWWYDGIQPFNLGIVDSGIVDSVQALTEPTAYSGDGQAGLISRTSQQFPMWFNTSVLNLTDSVTVGDNLHLFTPDAGYHSEFTCEILEINIANNSFRVNLFPGAGEYWRPPIPDNQVPSAFYGLLHVDYNNSRFWIMEGETWADSRAPAAIFDSSKSWLYEDYQGFLLMNGKDATKGAPIVSNDPTTISYDSLDGNFDFVAGDQYYIVWQAPHLINKIVNFDWYWYNLDSVFVNEIYFSQIYFHRNRLYAIGREIIRHTVEYDRWNVFTAGDTTSTGRVWFSDLGRMGYIPSDFNFDIYGANPYGENISIFSSDATNHLFVLRNDLHLLTESNIYRISGEPIPGPEDLWISQVIQGLGSNQPNGVIITRDNKAYIMNQQGIWVFNGIEVNKISYFVDPLVERYRGSRMVAGQFKDNIFFSYPDSNKTLLFFDPLKKFYGPWSVGMLTINDQFVAIDSNYFLFSRVEDSAYVLKYPRDNTNYTDIFIPGDTSIIVAEYLSGHQTLGIFRDKILQDIEITAYNPGVSTERGNVLSIYRDFSSALSWYDSTFAGGNRIHVFDNIGDVTDSSKITAKSFQIGIKDSTEFDFFISNYLLRWYPADGK